MFILSVRGPLRGSGQGAQCAQIVDDLPRVSIGTAHTCTDVDGDVDCAVVRVVVAASDATLVAASSTATPAPQAERLNTSATVVGPETNHNFIASLPFSRPARMRTVHHS